MRPSQRIVAFGSFVTLLVFGAPAVLWAQSPGSSPAISEPTADLLLQTAKASLPNVPDEIAVVYLLEAGRAEAMRLAGGSTQAGLDDMARAFNLALQMSSHGDGPEAMLRRKIKESSEELAVDFTALLDVDQALAMVRRADVPRDRLYDQVLYSQAIAARHDRKALAFEFMPIIRECMASGAFPYRGAIQIIQNAAIPEDQRLMLARTELQYAENGDDANLLNASQALVPIHQIFPQLDSMTVDAATSILGQLAAVVQRGKMAAGAARRQGTFLLAALQAIDPTRETELAARYPEFVAAAPVAASSPALYGSIHAGQVAMAEQLPSPPPDSADVNTRFAIYAQRAAVLVKKDPRQALDEARHAQSLVTSDLLGQSGMPQATLRLAMTLKALGASRGANDLLGRSLDALAATDAAREKAYREGDSTAAQQFVLQQAGARDGETWRALLVADKVNFEITARRVLVWPATITRIAALIAVAWGSSANPDSALTSRN